MTDNEKALRELRGAMEKVFCIKACFTTIFKEFFRFLRYFRCLISGQCLLCTMNEKENEYSNVYKIIKEYKESVTNTGSESIEIAENLRAIRAIYKAEMSARSVSATIGCGIIAGVIALIGIWFSANIGINDLSKWSIIVIAASMIMLFIISNLRQKKASIIVSVIQDILKDEEEKHKHNKEPVKVEITMKK